MYDLVFYDYFLVPGCITFISFRCVALLCCWICYAAYFFEPWNYSKMQ